VLIDFLYELRSRGLHVSTHEWMALMEGMALGLHESSLDGFYRLSRSLCVKDVAKYDAFDEAFLAYFKDVHADALALTQELLRWLENPAVPRPLTDEERAMIQSMDLEQVRALFEQRLREQRGRHDRGPRWVGTGGTSPFGNGGTNPNGIRVGGAGGARSAMQIAGERRYRGYRKDVVLDVRQIDVALRDLRQLGREGATEELDLDETVDETCRNAGELELVFRPPRRNRVKLILMMDVGGSMDPYAELMSRLFTAASRSGRFAKFRSYYFHNCVYDRVYEDAHFKDGIHVGDLMATSDRDEKLVMVGDAWMHPGELLQPGGAIFYSQQNRQAGIDWLRRLSEHFRRSAWLNPEPRRFWKQSTIEIIANVFPMWPLSIAGIEGAVRYLVRGGRTPSVDDED
jgi:uncharacterized protein with von Willebrand factor type A (vWA) domain